MGFCICVVVTHHLAQLDPGSSGKVDCIALQGSIQCVVVLAANPCSVARSVADPPLLVGALEAAKLDFGSKSIQVHEHCFTIYTGRILATCVRA